VAGSIAVPALTRLGPPPGPAQAQDPRLTDGIRTAAAAAMILGGLTLAAGSGEIPVGVALILAGGIVGLPALRRLVPPGTMTVRPGLPATIASRGLLTFAFFGADAYVTLAITAVKHRSPVVAGLAVTGATLSWTAGSWVQARLSDSWEGRRLVRTGLAIVLAGIALMALDLLPALPVAEGIAAWTVAGLGMGLAYAPLSLLMLRHAQPGQEGRASASLNLTDVLGTAVGIGVGGAAVAAEAGRDLRVGIWVAFAAAAAVGVLALVVTRRLPAGPTSAPAETPDGADHRSPAASPLPANAEIAAQLNLSAGTVRHRLDRIRAKTGSSRRADLVRFALQAGLV
jgi:MFS family permease